ncbi:Fic family protein [Inquilinus sp.]|uniref:Fic family protein n=1 Tax=Inquilinus sp. TaxID=1932117 RepID=UPI003783126E
MSTTATQEQVDEQLARIAALKLELDVLRPHAAEALAGLGKARLLEMTYTSNAIEGNTLTRAETEIIIEKGLAVGGKPFRDYQEAVDLHQAHVWMLELASSAEPIDNEVVLEIHRKAVAGTRTDGGVLSVHMRMVQGMSRIFPRPDKLPRLMAEFGEWLVAREPTPEIAIEAHARLVEIHPFNDGNGRTGRLLMNALLVRGGYPPVVIQPETKGDYIHALNERHFSPTSGPLLYQTFMLARVLEALEFEVAVLQSDLDVQRRLASSTPDAADPETDKPLPKGGGSLSAMYNPQPSLEMNSRTNPSHPTERFEVMKPQLSQQQEFTPGAHASIVGEVVRLKEFDRMTSVTIKSHLPSGFDRYNQVQLFDEAARRSAAGLEDGALVSVNAYVRERVFENEGREEYRTEVISNRIDRAEPDTEHRAQVTITGEIRRGFLAKDNVTMGSLVTRGKDGEQRYHSFKAFDEGARDGLKAPQIGDQLTLTGTLGTNSYEKDGKKVYTTDMVVDQVVSHTPAPNPAPAPLAGPGNEHRQENKPTHRPR